jgi:hypothetical protein
MTSYKGRRNRPPGEYLTFWYVCQIGPDAVSLFPSDLVGPRVFEDASEQVRELGTSMPDEAGYVGHLVTHEVANQLLNSVEGTVLAVAFGEWLRSTEIDNQILLTEAQRREEEQNHS